MKTATKNKLIAALALVMLVSAVLGALVGCKKTEYNFDAVYADWNDVECSANAGTSVSASGCDYSSCESLQDSDYGKTVAKLSYNRSVTYEFNVAAADKLALYLDWNLLHNGLADSEVEITVNGETVSERSSLKALWRNSTEDFDKDSYGNQIVPIQQKIAGWQSDYLYEYDYATVLPPVYGFKAGGNTVTFKLTSDGEILLGDVCLKSVALPETYADYISKHSSAQKATSVSVAEAENVYSKNTLSAVPTANSATNVSPYDTYASMLNTIAGFDSPNQILTYKFNAETDGLYNISFNVRNDNSNRTVFTQVFVDGETPFRELLRYPFVENGGYEKHTLGNKDGYYSFYLTKGEHTVSVKIDGSVLYSAQATLNELIDQLNGIYLDLKQIAGTVSDGNREWDVDNDFPGVVEKLQSYVKDMEELLAHLREINGTDVNYQAIILVNTAKQAVESLLKKPTYIPNKYAQIAEGSGSIVQTLANALADIKATPLTFDKIVLHGADVESGISKRSGWKTFGEGVKKFFHSFFADYSNVTDDDKTIQVWVARSRQYVDLMQQMIDGSDFKERTGYDVKFSILADEGKLILSNAAKIAPDVVTGISSWLPYEMGIRDLTVDLTQFDDYGEVISRFSEGALISLIADGRGLALPETQDFYVMYYRKDILQRYGIALPDTWNDVLSILPTLQRYGLNFYIPLSTSTSSKSIMTTAPFIYQYGDNLFTDDGQATTISSEKGLAAIKFMTEMYTLYGLPQQVSNFFDSFRSGSLPIGVSTFETYIRLSIAAPEISGKWGIALSPGMYDESLGEVARWQTGSATSMTLLKSGNADKDKAGWELLKWWSSEEVQIEYMNRLTMIYGKSYIWNSANLGAFNNSVAFTAADKRVISEQWKWMREIPKVPGWYMLERELSNAWNSIVIDGENTRSVVENAVTTIDKELRRKLTEFGYLKGGETVKPYKVTTLESVRELKNGG